MKINKTIDKSIREPNYGLIYFLPSDRYITLNDYKRFLFTFIRYKETILLDSDIPISDITDKIFVICDDIIDANCHLKVKYFKKVISKYMGYNSTKSNEIKIEFIYRSKNTDVIELVSKKFSEFNILNHRDTSGKLLDKKQVVEHVMNNKPFDTFVNLKELNDTHNIDFSNDKVYLSTEGLIKYGRLGFINIHNQEIKITENGQYTEFFRRACEMYEFSIFTVIDDIYTHDLLFNVSLLQKLIIRIHRKDKGFRLMYPYDERSVVENFVLIKDFENDALLLNYDDSHDKLPVIKEHILPQAINIYCIKSHIKSINDYSLGDVVKMITPKRYDSNIISEISDDANIFNTPSYNCNKNSIYDIEILNKRIINDSNSLSLSNYVSKFYLEYAGNTDLFDSEIFLLFNSFSELLDDLSDLSEYIIIRENGGLDKLYPTKNKIHNGESLILAKYLIEDYPLEMLTEDESLVINGVIKKLFNTDKVDCKVTLQRLKALNGKTPAENHLISYIKENHKI